MTLLMRDNENKLLGKYMHLIDQVKKLDVKMLRLLLKYWESKNSKYMR
ncbi:MAG: hypothetical protein ACLTDF_01280 [Coprococcus sp.]